MLYYIAVHESEGLDESEGQDVVRNTEPKSKQCITCHFRYERHVCDGCYNCIMYKKENYTMIFRVIQTKKGTFRTVSSYFYSEIEQLLDETELNKRFGWLYKDKTEAEIEHDNSKLDEIMEELCWKKWS